MWTFIFQIVKCEEKTIEKIDDKIEKKAGDELTEDFVDYTPDLVAGNTTEETNNLVDKLRAMEAAFDQFVNAVSEKQATLKTQARDMYPNYSEIIKNSKDVVTNFTTAIETDV